MPFDAFLVRPASRRKPREALSRVANRPVEFPVNFHCSWYYRMVIPGMPSVLKTVKIPQTLASALTRLAKARACTESELIRKGIESVVREDDGIDMQKLLGPDIGVGRGPKDLSSNRKRLAGYGRSRDS